MGIFDGVVSGFIYCFLVIVVLFWWLVDGVWDLFGEVCLIVVMGVGFI